MTRWFKMPTGTAQNPVFGIIAKKMNAPKSLILGVYTIAAELFSEENKKAKNRQELSEIISYTLAEDCEFVSEILNNFEQRGLIDANGGIVGIEQASSGAERVRKWREKQREKTCNVTGNVTGNAPEMLPLTHRPDQNRRERENPLTPVTQPSGGGGQGFRSFSEVLGVGSVGRFDIEQHLHEDDYIEIHRLAPGWDKKKLFEKYNAWVANDPPRNPRGGFTGWLKKFTKGKAQ